MGGAAGCALAAAMNGGAPLDPDHCVIALKRLAVSNASPGNQNPTLSLLALGGLSVTDGSAGFAVGGPALAASALRAPGSAELEPGGDREALTVSWFATAGSFDPSRSAYQPSDCDATCMMADPPAQVVSQWTPPTIDQAMQYAPAGAVDFWAVVRDDRGGVGWLSGRATSGAR